MRRRELQFRDPEPDPALPTSDRLWTVQEAASYLGIPVATLYGWRSQHRGPRAFRVGRWLRYDPADVRLWLMDQAS